MRSKVRVGSIVMLCYEWQRTIDFWKAALDYEIKHEDPNGGFVILGGIDGTGPNISIDQIAEPRKGKRSKLHLDLYTSEQESEVIRLIELGAVRYPWRYPEGADYVVLADPDDNLFCVVQENHNSS